MMEKVQKPSNSVTYNQIHHILIDTKQHSSILDAQSFKAADSETDHYLEVAMSKQQSTEFIWRGSISRN
jgi:UDP-N-acetylglucosamine 2-epimerase